MKKKSDDNKWCTKYVYNNDRCWWWLASLVMAAMLAMITTACSEEVSGRQEEAETEGLPATIRLEVKTDQPMDTQTRAVNEDIINDLYVLIYDKRGNMIGEKYDVIKYNNTTNTTEPFTVKTRIAGNDCMVYVLANTEGVKLNINTSMANMATPQLATDWDELSKKSYLIMTGSKKINITSAACSIGSISVSRIAAKVMLDIKTDSTDITIKNYKICSLPALGYYMPNPTLTEADKDDTGYVDAGKDASTDLSKWIEGTETEVNANVVEKVFYMYENRRGVKTGITMQKDKIKDNAPENATYMIINGEAGGYMATWVIYLGANNTSNFNIKRNCSYVYTIRLKEGNVADTRVDVVEKAFPTTDGVSSNCYMVTPGEAVTIPVIRANQSTIAIGGTTTQITATTEWEAEVVWQSSPFLVYLKRSTRSGKGADGRFTVAATDAAKSGNAVVAIRNKTTKDILWSWHIWVTMYTGSETFETNNGKRNYIFMDRALGATSAIPGEFSSCGLHYQWGRKDPFPSISQDNINGWSIPDYTDPIRVYNACGVAYEIAKIPVPSVTPNNLTNATRRPDTFYYNANSPNDWFVFNSSSAQNNNLWSGGNAALVTAAPKSVFDPCPEGWRIAPWLSNTSPFAGMTIRNGPWDDSYHGRIWGNTGGYFPASGYRYNSSHGIVGAAMAGYNWFGTAEGTGGRYIAFNSLEVHTVKTNVRAIGFPLRCCLDNL